ncbi:MAG: putative signal transduction protein with EFhand domain [Schlesneria sp.]|nr:putative signal transduction protein with EFhand domain [Schlesneria sp.]
MQRTHWGTVAVAVAILSGSVMTALGQDADAGSLFKRLDKNRDGQVASDEVPEEQQRLFQRLVRLGDKNGDGKLTAEEFEMASQPEESPNVPLNQDGDRRADGRQRFEMLDRNKDGKVTLDEVPEPLRDRLKPIFDRSGKQELSVEDFGRFGGDGRPSPAEFFKRFDANADGKVSKEELPAEARERLAPLFERLGKDEVTLEQFQQFSERTRDAMGRPGMGNPEEMFGRLDANRDGKLTVEEAPERARPMVEAALRRAGKEVSGSLTKAEFVKNVPQGRDGARPPAGERRPEGDRPREGARPAEPERSRDDGRRPDGGREPRPDPATNADNVRSPDRRVDGNQPRGRSPTFVQLLDTNRDGRLTKDELSKAAEKFDELDQNHDGLLDSTELIGGSAVEPEPRRDERMRRPDGDTASRERSAPFFQRLDRDADGKISKDEAPEQLKERFGMLDTNGDGFINLDEFRVGAGLLGERVRDRAEPLPRQEAPTEGRRGEKFE